MGSQLPTLLLEDEAMAELVSHQTPSSTSFVWLNEHHDGHKQFQQHHMDLQLRYYEAIFCYGASVRWRIVPIVSMMISSWALSASPDRESSMLSPLRYRIQTCFAILLDNGKNQTKHPTIAHKEIYAAKVDDDKD